MLSIFTLRFYTQGVIIGQEAKYTFPKLLSHVNTNPYAIIHLGVLFEKHIYENLKMCSNKSFVTRWMWEHVNVEKNTLIYQSCRKVKQKNHMIILYLKIWVEARIRYFIISIKILSKTTLLESSLSLKHCIKIRNTQNRLCGQKLLNFLAV